MNHLRHTFQQTFNYHELKRGAYLVLFVFLCSALLLVKTFSLQDKAKSHITSDTLSYSTVDMNVVTDSPAESESELDSRSLSLQLRQLKMHNALRFVNADISIDNFAISGLPSHKPSQNQTPDVSIQMRQLEQKVRQWEADFLISR